MLSNDSILKCFVLFTSDLAIRCNKRSLIAHLQIMIEMFLSFSVSGPEFLMKRSVKLRKEKWQQMAKEEFDKLPMKINGYFNAKTVSWAEFSTSSCEDNIRWSKTERRGLPRPVLWITNKLPIMMGWLAGWINTSQHLNEVCYTSSLPDTPLWLQPAPTLITLITGNT